jgi:hypothetical protein
MQSGSPKTESSFEVIPGAADFENGSRDIELPCYLIKPHVRNKDFYARDDILQMLDDALLPSSSGASGQNRENLKTFVLCGLGGIGKTQMALEYAFSRQDCYDAIFVLHADQTNKLADEFVQISTRLGLETVAEAKDPINSREAVKDWLAWPVKRSYRSESFGSSQNSAISRKSSSKLANWLIVFDNADQPEILNDFWPSNGYGSVLVTSRDPMTKTQFFFGDAGLEVEPLSNDNTASFLRDLTVSHHEPEAEETSKAIAHQLGGVPLAIVQMAAIIRRQSLSLKDFSDLYKEGANLHALHQLRIGAQRGYEHSLASVWALDQLSPGALVLLNVLSFLDPDAIQEEIILAGLQQETTSHYPKGKAEYHLLLTDLLQTSVIHRNGERRELWIHRLVQDVALAKMRTVKDEFQKHFDLTVFLLTRVWPFIAGGGVGRAHKVGRWDLCAKIFPHINRLRQLCVASLGTESALAASISFANLVNEAGW